MEHTVALVASLASLGLVCAIYYCNILARPGSWLRGDMLAMILLSLLTGLFPLALAAGLAGLLNALSGGISAAAVLSAGADLTGLGAVLATVVVFRALVRATYRKQPVTTNVTPLTPSSGPAPRKIRKAA